MKIISGGQTGVDQIGLFVAREQGIETGGTAPKGWKTDEGPAPWLADYGLVESRWNGYRMRTIENVHAAGYTVWFGDATSPGGQLTIATCERLGRRYRINPTPDELRAALDGVLVLNVAGNRLRTSPAASVEARAVLRIVLDACR